MKNKIIYLIAVLITTLIPIVNAEKPYYFLSISISSTFLNRGDACKIWIFISGEGKPSKTIVFYDIPNELLKNRAIMVYEPKGLYKKDCYYFDLETQNWFPKTSKMYTTLYESCFSPSCYDKNIPICGATVFDKNGNLVAPINIEFDIDKKTKPGDYALKFHLYYKYENNTYNDEDTIKIHVNSFYEQYQSDLWFVGIMITLIPIIFVMWKKIIISIKNKLSVAHMDY
jgi:hypothetical protein